jgi:hypothetical protein
LALSNNHSLNQAILLVFQIENEYGSYFGFCDYDYLRYLRKKALTLMGDNVLLITTDGNHVSPELTCGTIEGVYATVDFRVTSKSMVFVL